MGVDTDQITYASAPSTHDSTAYASNSSRSSNTKAMASKSSSHLSSPVSIRGRKRKLHNTDTSVAESATCTQPPQATPTKKRVATKPASPVAPLTIVSEEKRLRRFRAKAPSNFDAVYERATTQRFFVLSRTLRGTEDCPEMLLEVSGSTGNLYNVCITRQPTCDCPHAKAGNQCKHTIFVLSKVLKAKHQYVYQLALLNSELREIFSNAPMPEDPSAGKEKQDNNRKPIDGDCPICFEEMKSGPRNEELVWCKAACGQNIHRQCFDMWAATKGQAKTTCPYCRSKWESEEGLVDLANIKKTGKLTSEGYVNIADQLGVSTRRDHSTYSTWWSGHSGYRRRYWR